MLKIQVFLKAKITINISRSFAILFLPSKVPGEWEPPFVIYVACGSCSSTWSSLPPHSSFVKVNYFFTCLG